MLLTMLTHLLIICSKLAYFRSAFSMDIFKCDIMSSNENYKPKVLLCEQCLNMLCQVKSNQLTNNGLSSDSN